MLMTNHVHLLMSLESLASTPRIVIALRRRYVLYINLRLGVIPYPSLMRTRTVSLILPV